MRNMLARNVDVSLVFVLVCCLALMRFAESKLPQAEVDALEEITTKMGAKYWKFNDENNSCEIEMVGVTKQAPERADFSIECQCGIDNTTFCHVVKLALKFLNLPGILPPELVKLPYLQQIDFAYNYLSGSIPLELVSLRLNRISLLANRLSGEIPRELGNMTTLAYLDLEANQFSGNIPHELETLVNLKTLLLSSNNLTGMLPTTFAGLSNLTDFRINDNNFSGQIPEFIWNWENLTRLEMHASGLEGPIPSGISQLNLLTQLRISDIKGPIQEFPVLRASTGLGKLVLRNCNLSGEIPAYIWNMRNLKFMDVSFNRLTGRIPNEIGARDLRVLFLTSNMFSGDVPESILKDGISIDISYNNFTWQGPEQPTCRSNMNLYINLFKSSSTMDNIKSILPCTNDFECPRYGCSLHVNSGGNDIKIQENKRDILYEGDGKVNGGTSRYYLSDNNNWGFSSTGDFMDDDNYQNTRYIETAASPNQLTELYSTARLSPLSLTYFHRCLENGTYNVSLHFAEIQFRNGSTYSSLGRRLFDIYIQEELLWKDFNIAEQAHGFQTSVVKSFVASVTNNILEIRFHWAGKGTTRVPSRGVYGPLVSAISINPTFKICTDGKKKSKVVYVIVIVGVLASVIVSFAIIILWFKGCIRSKKRRGKDFEGLKLQTVSFTLRQIKAATNNFDSVNKVGEGGFGPVYKGSLSDGTVIAVKQLSAKSRQGNREFLNEIGMISCLQHPNLVKLHGCCIDEDQLLLVYEYMENNSLANALFSSEKNELMLDWETRFRICIGIAKGLAFLHEESRMKIVHRDIKSTNVLLDKDLNPKISDFGLARLNEDDKSHVSTRVAGTMGYMAPEYALWGYLSDKADVYSFGVVVLEIVSGKNNNTYMPSNNCICLLDWACQLQPSGNFEELLDERLKSKVNKDEAEKMVKIAVLCTNGSPNLRPIMSEVVKMLGGKMDIPEITQEPSTYLEDLRFKAMRDFHRDKQQSQTSFNASQAFSSSSYDEYGITVNSKSYL